jgi:hypothetical protein
VSAGFPKLPNRFDVGWVELLPPSENADTGVGLLSAGFDCSAGFWLNRFDGADGVLPPNNVGLAAEADDEKSEGAAVAAGALSLFMPKMPPPELFSAPVAGVLPVELPNRFEPAEDVAPPKRDFVTAGVEAGVVEPPRLNRVLLAAGVVDPNAGPGVPAFCDVGPNLNPPPIDGCEEVPDEAPPNRFPLVAVVEAGIAELDAAGLAPKRLPEEPALPKLNVGLLSMANG